MRLRNKMSYRYGLFGGACKALCLVFALLLMFAEAAKARELRVLAFGDSLTQGYGLPEADGFALQLEAWLRGRGMEVRIINGGVSGDTTAGGAARIAWSLSESVDAMILNLGANDMLRGLAAPDAQENLTGIVKTAKAGDVKVLLVGMRAATNFGPAYASEFEAIYPALAEAEGLTLIKNYFAPLGETPSEAFEWMQDDGIHPNAEGVARIIEALGPQIEVFLKGVDVLAD